MNGKIAFIFVFKKGCISCSGNLVFWNKLSALVKGKKINTYGIILNRYNSDLNTFYEKLKHKINFRVYFPDNIKTFEEKFRIHPKLLPYTLLCGNGEVLYISFGDIQNDLKKIINCVKKNCKQGGKNNK